MVHDKPTAVQRRFLLGRKFVLLPREARDIPDDPLRHPDHYCLDCGAMRIRCWQCEGTVRWPITQVRDGLHIGRCDEHGTLAMICPSKPALSNDERAALASQPVEPARLSYRPPSPEAPLATDEVLEHERKRVRVAIAAGVMVGFVLGVLLTLITVFVLSAAR